MSQGPAFDAELDASPEHELGSAIEVTFRLTNSSDRAYQVLTWYSPLDRKGGDFLVVRGPDGDTLSYDGPYVTRRNPGPGAYITLAPGQTVTRTFDVARTYPIKTAGRYAIELDARLLDAIELSGSEAAQPRSLGNNVPVRLERSSVTVQVTGVGDPALTDGERDRGASGPPRFHVPEGSVVALGSAVARPEIKGGTKAQKEMVNAAHDLAVEFCLLCHDQLTNKKESSKGLYEMWFGPYDDTRSGKVAQNYGAIAHYLQTTPVIYDTEDFKSCEPDDSAWTRKGSNTVRLCKGFWEEGAQNVDSQWGTLIHEWTHAVCGTEDHEYGTRATRILATNDPVWAVENAENHQYFAELLPPCWTSGRPINDTDRTGRVPRAVEFGNKLYVFFKASVVESVSSIHYSASDDGVVWPPSKTVGGETTVEEPVAIAYKEKLHVFFAASDRKSGVLTANSVDGIAWTPSRPISPSANVTSVAAVVFKDKLYVYWQWGEDATFYYSWTSDGAVWVDGRIKSDAIRGRFSPAACVFQAKLFLFWRGPDNLIMFATSSDGSTWENAKQLNGHDTVDHPPAAVEYQGMLYLLWKAPNNDPLWVTASTDGVRWPQSHRLNDADTATFGVSAVAYRGTMYAFFRVTGSPARIYCCKLTLPVAYRYGPSGSNGRGTHAKA